MNWTFRFHMAECTVEKHYIFVTKWPISKRKIELLHILLHKRTRLLILIKWIRLLFRDLYEITRNTVTPVEVKPIILLYNLMMKKKTTTEITWELIFFFILTHRLIFLCFCIWFFIKQSNHMMQLNIENKGISKKKRKNYILS